MSDGDTQMRRGLLARVLLEVLQDAAAPLAAKDAIARVEGTVELNSRELTLNPSGFARFDTYLRFLSSWARARWGR